MCNVVARQKVPSSPRLAIVTSRGTACRARSTGSQRSAPSTEACKNDVLGPVALYSQGKNVRKKISCRVLVPLSADSGANYRCQRIRPAPNVFVTLSFNHHARQRLSAGITQNHAPGFTERLFRFAKRPRNLRKGFQWWFRFHTDIHDLLRIDFQISHERVKRSRKRNDRCKFNSREHSIAGRSIVEKKNVPRLLAAKIRSNAQHLFKNVAVADGGARQFQPRLVERALESEICHRGADNHIALQLAGRFHVASGNEQYAVAIHQLSRSAGKNCAVRITIE